MYVSFVCYHPVGRWFLWLHLFSWFMAKVWNHSITTGKDVVFSLKNFFISIFKSKFVNAPRWYHFGGEAVGAHILHKGVTVRFGFDVLESRKFKLVCQEQSNGNVSWDVYIQLQCVCPYSNKYFVGTLYIHQRGAFGVARFDRQGNARALTRGTSDRTGSTFFVSVCKIYTYQLTHRIDSPLLTVMQYG